MARVLLRKQKWTTCNTALFFPTKHPALVVKGRRAAGGHLSWLLWLKIFKIKPEAAAAKSVWLASSCPDLDHLRKNQNYTNTTAHKHLNLITPFQLLVARRGCSPSLGLTKCVIPVA